MKGGDSGRTGSFGKNSCGAPVRHIYSSVEEKKAKIEVESGGPRHKENQAQVRYSTFYSGRPNDLALAY